MAFRMQFHYGLLLKRIYREFEEVKTWNVAVKKIMVQDHRFMAV